MSEIKSYSVGNGDMFYIWHNSDNFSMIDCCLNGDDKEDAILNELYRLKIQKGVTRFISTHPDEDHIRGLDRLDDKVNIINFYCVENESTKDEETDGFGHYCELRDSDRAFYLYKGCSRQWMNEDSAERGKAGINILWPDTSNPSYQDALLDAKDGHCPNNISTIVSYSVKNGVSALWMGDLETAFIELIEADLNLPTVDILFAPHHGRASGKVPNSLLAQMDPKIVVIGEAPSEHLHYYPGYDTITQRSAGDIIFRCVEGEVHVFTENGYVLDFLKDRGQSYPGHYYLGSFDTHA